MPEKLSLEQTELLILNKKKFTTEKKQIAIRLSNLGTKWASITKNNDRKLE